MDLRDETADHSVLPDVSDSHPELDREERLYAAHMQAREEVLSSIFGRTEPPDTILTSGDGNLMLNWPGGGVFVFPPQGSATAWHYVTHGLAQPMENPLPSAPVTAVSEGGEEPISGWGIELVLSTPDRNHWAPDVLLKLVKYLLFQEDSRVILPGDRVPCNGPIVLGTDTKITFVLAVRSRDYVSNLLLPAGYCSLVHLVGVTEEEIEWAQSWGPGSGGAEILEEVLLHYGIGTLTDPTRDSLTSQPDFADVWGHVQNRLEDRWRSNGWSGEGKSPSRGM